MNEYRVVQVKGSAEEMTVALNVLRPDRWQVAPGGVAFPGPGLMVALMERPAARGQVASDEEPVPVLGGAVVAPLAPAAQAAADEERKLNPLTGDPDGGDDGAPMLRYPGTCGVCRMFKVISSDGRCDACAGRAT